MKLGRIALLAFWLVVGIPVAAQAKSISLQVENTVQQTLVWCWVAVSQMIVKYYNDGDAPKQCRIMEMGFGLPPDYCCGNPNRCARTGALEEMQRIIRTYSHQASLIAGPPPSPRAIYNTLRHNNLIVAAISSGGGGGHVVVVRGIRNVFNRIELLINDPMSRRPVVIGYNEFRSQWQQSIVVRYRPLADEDDEDLSAD